MRTPQKSTHSSHTSMPDFMRGTFRLPQLLTFLVALLASIVVCAAVTMAQTEITSSAPHAHAIPSAPRKTYTPASFLASPGLECKLYAAGRKASRGLNVFTDDDGYARFHAVRATASDAIQRLNLDCTDSTGKPYSYSVDLTSDDTFAPRPLNLANERGTDRPALKGDPLSYSESELIQAGYGPRPDPSDTGAYGRWLEAASLPARMLDAKRPSPFTHTVTKTDGNPWTGSLLTGAPNYISAEATFNVPKAIPNADETNGTSIAIWNGVGGDGASGLIQGGVDVETSDGAAIYGTFREYCCGDGVSNNYSGNFVPNPGDKIYSIEWYCDSKGNIDLKGGYGCTHLHDLTTGQLFVCTSPTGSPCPSVPALPLCSVSPKVKNCMVLGGSAEFVIELTSPQTFPASNAFTQFTPEVTMTGSAYSSTTKKYSQTISTDPAVGLMTDFTNAPSHLTVSLGKTNQTYFSVSQFAEVSGKAPINIIAESIAVGPNAHGSNIGDAWVLGETADSDGNYSVYQWQDQKWVKQPGAGTHIAVSPGGNPWLINASGEVSYWDGSAFTAAPKACATWIAVGPNFNGSKYGDAWITGCENGALGNNSIYELQNSKWVKQPGSAFRIAVSPAPPNGISPDRGRPWTIDASGNIYYWNGSGFTAMTNGGCAVDIAVGPATALYATLLGDVWILGCDEVGDGFAIYQLQNGVDGQWVQVPGAAIQLSVSPDLGVPWVVNSNGNIFE
jgi:hypothetical protein